MVSLTSSSPVPNSKHPILIICEQRLVGEGVKLLVNAQPDMEVVREVQQYSEAIPLLQACQPEVVIFVPGEPRCSQTDVSAQIPEIVSRLKNAYAKAKVLVLAAARDVGSVRQFLKAGASGCLLTSAPTQALFQAIRTLAGGGVYLDDDLIDTFVSLLAPRPIGHLRNAGGELTAREEEVLRFVARGLQTREIAARLNIGIKTVDTHRARAMRRLNLHRRAEVVAYGVKHGWLTDGGEDADNLPGRSGPTELRSLKQAGALM